MCVREKLCERFLFGDRNYIQLPPVILKNHGRGLRDHFEQYAIWDEEQISEQGSAHRVTAVV